MLIEFAPMEGITACAFRRLHKKYFPGVDKYYMPFISPNSNRCFTPREMRDIAPEANCGLDAVPQLLGKNADDMVWAAGELRAMGYREINLNLGCPSGTVTAKGKGAGLLADTKALDALLYELFEKVGGEISVKTRLGMTSPDEFAELVEIYNKYPLSELVVHPRIRTDFYRVPVRKAEFERFLGSIRAPVSYNGGLVTPEDVRGIMHDHPEMRAVMLGQGLASDPFLADRVRNGAASDREKLRSFHDELLDAYTLQFGDRMNAVKRMKELWVYLIRLFDADDRMAKRIFKARDRGDYDSAVAAVFREAGLLEQSRGGW